MDIQAIKIDSRDTVATCMQEARPSDRVNLIPPYQELLLCVSTIPAWHKIALVDIKPGDEIFKYGECIGTATAAISKGGWVSHLNVVGGDRKYDDELWQEAL